MPTNIVDVDLQSQTGAVSQQTYSDLLIVARNPTVSDPTYNNPLVFDSADQVATEFGENSDAYIASQEVERAGARQWWVVMLEATEEVDEGIGNSGSESTDNGSVSNTPIQGGVDNITVELDGNEKTVVPATGSPPEKPDSTDEAAVNFDTGEVVIGESSDGAADGISVTYNTLSWDTAFPEMSTGDFDLTCLANTRADRSYIGELDELLTWAESEAQHTSMVVAYENGNNYEDDEAAVEAAHEIGGYIPSGRVLPIAHKSDDDVASGVAGRLAIKRPWFDPYMDGGANYSFSIDEFRKSVIGSPNQPGTFEGGDENGAGPCNVLYTDMGTQILSNSMTTAGSSSNYQFFDVSRTEDFVISEVDRALNTLQLNHDQIPFAPIGRTLIEAAIRTQLNQYVAPSGRAIDPVEIAQQQSSDGEDGENGDGEGGDGENNNQQSFSLTDEEQITYNSGNDPLSELEILVPRYDDLPQTDRANRRWSGIQISAQLAGSAHTFGVELTVSV